MNQKVISGDCINCESSFHIQYLTGLVSSDYPQHCPFCGETIEDINDEYIDGEDDYEDGTEWED
jgi:hypothetical protein